MRLKGRDYKEQGHRARARVLLSHPDKPDGCIERLDPPPKQKRRFPQIRTGAPVQGPALPAHLPNPPNSKGTLSPTCGQPQK
jgi:hypothetical protein